MKLGLVPYDPHAPFRDMRALALAAEAAGFDSFWLPDHLLSEEEDQGFWDAFTILSAIAALTQRITIGSLVACASFRNPGLVAKIADTLDEVSQGRFVLGLGAGWYQPEHAAFGYPFDHLTERFEEALQIIVPLLRDGQADFSGAFVQARNARLIPRGPTPGGPPILIGARRPRMLRLVARYADAWNTNGLDTSPRRPWQSATPTSLRRARRWDAILRRSRSRWARRRGSWRQGKRSRVMRR